MSERASNHIDEAPATNLQSLAEPQHYAVADPFAKDLFAIHAPIATSFDEATDEEQTPVAAGNFTPGNPPPDTAWARRLPSVSIAEADSSNNLPALPALFARRFLHSIEQVIAATTHVPSGDVSLEILDVREAIFASETRETAAAATMEAATARAVATNGSSTMRARLSGEIVRGTRWSATIETGSALALALADWILGGERRLVWDMRRALDPACLAVVEFLILRVVHHLRSEVGGGIRIEELCVAPHYDPSAKDADDAELDSAPNTGVRQRGMIVVLSLAVDDVRGILRCHIPPNTLAACVNIDGAIDTYASQYVPERLERLTRLLPRLSAAVIVGASELRRDELAALEPGDVIVLTRAERWIAGDAESGELSVRVGTGDGVLLVGECVAGMPDTAGDADEQCEASGAHRQISLKLAEVRRGRSPRDGGVTEMDDTQQEGTEEAPIAVALDDLIVEVHVELPSRRIRLGELADLRVNQIIDLRCSPLDPVELVVDGRAVARGELVDIEGRLGVRITSVRE